MATTDFWIVARLLLWHPADIEQIGKMRGQRYSSFYKARTVGTVLVCMGGTDGVLCVTSSVCREGACLTEQKRTAVKPPDLCVRLLASAAALDFEQRCQAEAVESLAAKPVRGSVLDLFR